MFLPEDLHERRFHDWNATVRGLVGVWELARSCGMEEQLGSLLSRDRDGAATEQLARIGNGFYSLAEVLCIEIDIRQGQQPQPSVPTHRESPGSEHRPASTWARVPSRFLALTGGFPAEGS